MVLLVVEYYDKSAMTVIPKLFIWPETQWPVLPFPWWQAAADILVLSDQLKHYLFFISGGVLWEVS
jgi:hypothetical protein